MHKCNCVYSAGAAPAHLPGKQVRLRTAVRAGALYMRPARHHQSVLERKLNKVLTNQGKMQKDIAAVNKALVTVNMTPVASLVLGVLYIMYTNFKVSGGG